MKAIYKIIEAMLVKMGFEGAVIQSVNLETGVIQSLVVRHCCKVSDEAAFCLIQRPYISKTLLTRRISPRGSP